MSPLRIVFCLLLALSCLRPVAAVTGVHPFGVNVRSSGASTVFLTFQNLDPGERAAEAFWCGELRADLMAANPQLQLPVAVQSVSPCVPGTIYGRLPVGLDRSQPSSGGGSLVNLTDIMTIPASVSRRAYQDAAAGRHSAFFYVRRFAGAAGDRYVVVTCRMGGGGARTPLALTDVRVGFAAPVGARASVLAIARDGTLPRWTARLLYTGSGTLRGRWEVVQPGDPEPADEDLVTAATLPLERRALQRRWRVVERFEVFLPPTGELVLDGPEPALAPTAIEGPYKLLLRIEASDDKEGTSNLGNGRTAVAGGVAGFALPVLRYDVGSPDVLAALPTAAAAAITLLSPAAGPLAEGTQARLSWIDRAGTTLYELQIEADRQPAFSAIVVPGAGSYTLPPWFVESRRNQALRWRVVALGNAGRVLATSGWCALELR